MLELLRRLDAATGDGAGAQRVAWTDTWRTARDLLAVELSSLPVEVTTDGAANTWALLEGPRPETVLIGSHLDSVPGGGWLDGAFGVMCALEVLRTLAVEPELPCSVCLVDWADEEGARFGRSLFGSAAAAGTLDVDAVRGLRDRDGERLEDVVRRWGVELDSLDGPRVRLASVAAYLEAHIEQGPVLEHEGVPIAAVTGTAGVERHRVVFGGETAHSGTTPMSMRHDALMAGARLALGVKDTALRHGGVGTVGVVRVSPGIPTAVPGEVSLVVDLRHQSAESLAAMLGDAREASRRAAEVEGCSAVWEPVFCIEPRRFDDRLVAIAEQVCAELTGRPAITMPSGALHDATEVSTAVPTGMVFTSSSLGLSHTSREDTPPDHLKLGLEAYFRVVRRVVDLVGTGGRTFAPASPPLREGTEA
jgi:beta-ureidopropionase / N-carbamoyl-L-amino-acid hydrolase